MSTALVPRALLPTQIHPSELTEPVRDAFDALMQRADMAAVGFALSLYKALHREAAALVGIQLPACGELAVCTCQDCICGRIFDACDARFYMDGTVEFVQCPGCSDDHRIYGDD